MVRIFIFFVDLFILLVMCRNKNRELFFFKISFLVLKFCIIILVELFIFSIFLSSNLLRKKIFDYDEDDFLVYIIYCY